MLEDISILYNDHELLGLTGYGTSLHEASVARGRSLEHRVTMP